MSFRLYHFYTIYSPIHDGIMGEGRRPVNDTVYETKALACKLAGRLTNEWGFDHTDDDIGVVDTATDKRVWRDVEHAPEPTYGPDDIAF